MHTYFLDTRSKSARPLWSYPTGGYVGQVAISSNGTCSAAGDFDGNVFFFRSTNSGNPSWSFRANSSILGLGMSKDCVYLVAGDSEETLYLSRNGQTSPTIRRYRVPSGILAVSLSESGAFAATSAAGGLYFFAAQDSLSSDARVFQGSSSFPSVAISDDASHIVAGGGDGFVYLFNRSGQLTGREKLGGSITAPSFSSMVGRLVAGSTNGNASLYAIENGLREMGSVAGRRPITSICISENAERVSIANLDGEISMFNKFLTSRLWAFSAGKIVHTVPISGSGLVTAATSDNGNVHLFDEEVRGETNPTIVDVLLVSAIVTCLVLISMIWRRKRENALGKLYHDQRRSQKTEAS